MIMTPEKDEDLADLIKSQTGMSWDLIQADMHENSTEELIEGMSALGLYVNKKFALEVARRDDAVFYLRKLIQDGVYWRRSGPGEGWSPIHAMHILALIKSREALELLLDIIRYHNDDLFGWLTENVASLLVAFGEDAYERIKEFTEDATLETFARSAGVTGLAVLAKKYPSHLNDAKEHIIKLLNTTSDNTFASLIVDDLASFHDLSVLPEIHRVFQEGKIEEFHITEEDVELIIKGEYDDDFKRHTEEPIKHFSRESIEYLHSLHYDKPKENYTKGDKKPPKEKKVGRNDPCPCGSGKKYKKCCMGKEPS
jgi:hypothetical protein